MGVAWVRVYVLSNRKYIHKRKQENKYKLYNTNVRMWSNSFV